MSYRLKKINNQGFTIIELLIATAILSIIILIATIVMLNIGNLYYKGASEANIQDNVRNIADQLSNDLKYNNGTVTSGYGTYQGTTIGAYCIGGDVRYSFILEHEIGSGSGDVAHVLWRDDDSDNLANPNDLITGEYAEGCEPVNLLLPQAITDDTTGTNGGIELIGSSSQLTVFCVGPYSPGSSDSCPLDAEVSSPYTINIGEASGDSTLLNGEDGLNTACEGGTGFQYCATAALTTTAAQRLNGLSRE